MIKNIQFLFSFIFVLNLQASNTSNTELSPIPSNFQGHWTRVTTNCGEPLDDEALAKVVTSGDANMSRRARLMLSDDSFEVVTMAGEVCLNSSSSTAQTDNQDPRCDESYRSSRGTAYLNEDLGQIMLTENGSAKPNEWGIYITRAQITERSGVIQISVTHGENCSNGKMWNTYWAPFQGS